jgi:SAM-dependent methyltransferase
MMIDTLLEDAFRGLRAESILDVGPGYSSFSRITAHVTGAREITFLDVNSDVLAWQAQRTHAAGLVPRVIGELLDPMRLDAMTERYDIIHCQEVLEHLPDAAHVLACLARLLSAQGRVIITVPTRMSERWLSFLNPSYMKDEPYGHVNRFSAEELRTLVRNAGLELLLFRPIHPDFFVGHSWLAGTRMRIEGSTGSVLTKGPRGFIYGNLTKYSRIFFRLTGRGFWERLIPRNYFIIARRHDAVR